MREDKGNLQTEVFFFLGGCGFFSSSVSCGFICLCWANTSWRASIEITDEMLTHTHTHTRNRHVGTGRAVDGKQGPVFTAVPVLSERNRVKIRCRRHTSTSTARKHVKQLNCNCTPVWKISFSRWTINRQTSVLYGTPHNCLLWLKLLAAIS